MRRWPSVDTEDVPWVKSSYSTNPNGCVQIKRLGDHVLVGDSKHPDGPTLTVTAEEWDRFLDAFIAEGPESSGRLWASFHADGGFTLSTTDPRDPKLVYTQQEREAFANGARAGELRSHIRS
ncbi:DUF397 domain-containing protein [Streptomonospora sp. S1-112]|uniref:DUF397 domain-containing protein n=1 Tax=Streptomonospora mangrovi TaxID=2883123 RepID=A0A9X3SFT1_9ACTN|nr:DUF397 domain-containing protein [Streptomonospora mangrovi]MDA0565185.1 DUF397 domain-containing protein [Streptomonospora mangrovi]